jgi:hypothetical protein
MADDLPSGTRMYELTREALRIEATGRGRVQCLDRTEDRFVKTLAQLHASSKWVPIERKSERSVEAMRIEQSISPTMARVRAIMAEVQKAQGWEMDR